MMYHTADPGFEARRPSGKSAFFRSVPGTLLCVFCICSLLACNKNKDNSPYEIHLSVSNFILNADSLGILIDGVSLTGSRGLAFGATGMRDSILYLLPPAGFHNMQLQVNSKTVVEKTFQGVAKKYYTLIAYDSLKAGMVKTMLMQDSANYIDSLAKLRFINTIPGNDSLHLVITGDTATVTLSDVYLGLKTATGYEFSTALRNGNRTFRLFRGTTMLGQVDSFPVRKGKFYTVIAKGISGGTGVRAPSLSVLRNN